MMTQCFVDGSFMAMSNSSYFSKPDVGFISVSLRLKSFLSSRISCTLEVSN